MILLEAEHCSSISTYWVKKLNPFKQSAFKYCFGANQKECLEKSLLLHIGKQ